MTPEQERIWHRLKLLGTRYRTRKRLKLRPKEFAARRTERDHKEELRLGLEDHRDELEELAGEMIDNVEVRGS